MLIEVDNKEVKLHFSHNFRSYGHFTIKCVLTVDGEEKKFTHSTTDTEWIDQIHEDRQYMSYEDIQQQYYDKFYESDFKERVEEFMYFKK